MALGSTHDLFIPFLSFKRQLGSQFIILTDGSATAGMTNGDTSISRTEGDPTKATSPHNEEKPVMRMARGRLLPSHEDAAVYADNQSSLLIDIREGKTEMILIMSIYVYALRAVGRFPGPH